MVSTGAVILCRNAVANSLEGRCFQNGVGRPPIEQRSE